MLVANLRAKYGDAELAYSVLAKSTFAATLYAAVFLLATIQALGGSPESGSPPPMPPALAAITAILNVGLILLPVLIVLLFSFGYYGLIHRAMVGLAPEARESVWVARRWFQIFWILVVVAILVFFVQVAVLVLDAPEVVQLGLYSVFTVLPSALLIALVLFLGYAAWAALPKPSRKFLQWIVWADAAFVAGAAVGTVILTALAWPQIKASGILSPAYSPWTTIPSGAFNLGTLVLLYFAFRWARRFPPRQENRLATAADPPARPS